MGPAKPILRQSRHDQQEQSPQQLTLMQQFELQQQQLQQQQQQQQHLNNNNNNHYKTTVIPLVIEHANLDRIATSSNRSQNDPVNQRKVSNGDSLVQIYVPPTRKSDAESSLYNSSEDETLSAGSQDEENRTDDFSTQKQQNDETHETSSSRPKFGLNLMRTLSVDPSSSSSPVEDEGKSNRKIPPPLSDWNRSQSFPPPGKSFVSSEAGQKAEDNESSGRGNNSNVFGGRPLSKGVPYVASSILSCNSDMEGKKNNSIFLEIQLKTCFACLKKIDLN